jgi:hypothetical protein
MVPWALVASTYGLDTGITLYVPWQEFFGTTTWLIFDMYSQYHFRSTMSIPPADF